MKKLLALMLLAVLVLVPVGCGTQTTQSISSDKAPIKIGVIGAFSGPSAEMGTPMRKGIEMAVKEINDAGGIEGRKLEIVAYDDEANASKNATLVRRAIDTDKVAAILAAPSTGTSIATVKVVREMEVPHIVPIAQSPEVLEPFTPYSFRISATSTVDIERLITYTKSKNWRKVAIVHDTDAYGLSGEKILKEAIPAAGLEIVANEGHKTGATDLTAQALAVKQAKPDVVILWNLGADAALFAKSLKNSGAQIPLLAGRGLFFNVYTQMGGDAVEGTIATGALDFSRSDVKEWHDKFMAFGGSEGGIDFAALGYDATKLLGDAFKRSGAANAEDHKKLRDAIEATKDFKCITGYKDAKISFGPNNHEGADIKNSVVQVVKNGKWTMLDK